MWFKTRNFDRASRHMIERQSFDSLYSSDADSADALSHQIYSERGTRFFELIRETPPGRFLSVGGGIDTVALTYGCNDRTFISIDISEAATKRTQVLAKDLGKELWIDARTMACESIGFTNEFDIVCANGALHHFDLSISAEKISQALRPGGQLIASEPVCFSWLLRKLHRWIPLDIGVFQTETEEELREEHLNILRSCFQSVQCEYFELIARPSISFWLIQRRAYRLLSLFRLFDRVVLRALPFFSHLCQGVVIIAKK